MTATSHELLKHITRKRRCSMLKVFTSLLPSSLLSSFGSSFVRFRRFFGLASRSSSEVQVKESVINLFEIMIKTPVNNVKKKKPKKKRSKIRSGTPNQNASKKEREQTNKMKIEQKRADKLTDK